jgi:WD40-like Beta Propeller Repeat
MLAALSLFLSVASAPAPHLEWRTLESACCDIHFPIELEAVARRLAPIADSAVAANVTFLQSSPSERIQVVIHDVTDSPNGFANAVPYNFIDLRAVPPESDAELGATDDYLRQLVTHELLHVVHLDTIHGIPRIVNLVIGKTWPPNIIQPRFLVEGLATFSETRHTHGGRLRATLFMGQLRIAAQHGDLWSLDDLANSSRRPPGGGAAYLYGGAFIQWLSARHGEHIWAAIAHDYGGSVIPYAVQRSIEAQTGESLELSYAAFLEELRAEARAFEARVRARGGPTAARRLTRVGGNVRVAAFTDDARALVGLDPPNQPPGLYALDVTAGAAPRLTPVLRTEDVVDVEVAGRTVLFTQTEITDGWRSFHDLWRLEPDGTPSRVTRGARIVDVAWIPGTREVLAEQRTGADDALVRVDFDTGTIHDVTRHKDGTREYTPTVSRDGRAAVVSRHALGGARDLVWIDLATKAERRLTQDDAEDLDPVFSIDGARVLFASDREGTFAIYAIDIATLEVRRIVDTLGIALRPTPTPDGRALVFVDSHLDGQDLYAAPFDWDSAPRAAHAGPPPTPRDDLRPSTAEASRYNALWTLRPRTWLPVLEQGQLGGVAAGGAFSSEDIAGLYGTALSATWDFSLNRPRLSAGVRLQDLFVPLSFGLEWRTDVSDTLRTVDAQPVREQRTVLRGSATASIPILRKRRNSHTLSFGAQRELHVVETEFNSPPDARAPTYPVDRSITAGVLEWGSSSFEGGRDSVSLDRGLATYLRLRHANPLWGSAHEITEVSLDARVYEPVPGLPQHTLAVFASGGAAFGDPFVRARFGIGGFQERDLVRDLLDGTRAGHGVLRGYPRNVLTGDAYALGTLEYRLPLLEIERGPGTLPLFFDRLALVPFADLGIAFDGSPNPSQFKGALGAELRAFVTLGYYGAFMVRAGYARGLSRGGLDQPYVVMGVPY